MEYPFTIELSVRDYECDIQGVVNNSVYQCYLEHARHVYLKTLGIDFAALAARKINLVVTRVELDYKYPLKSSDSFWIGVRMERLSPVRFGFFQDIFRYPDNKLILKGLITGTALNERGRPFILPEFEKVFPDVVTF